MSAYPSPDTHDKDCALERLRDRLAACDCFAREVDGDVLKAAEEAVLAAYNGALRDRMRAAIALVEDYEREDRRAA